MPPHPAVDAPPGVHPERLLHLLGPTPALPNSPTSRIHRAIMLAPTIGVCEALLRGEDVPVSALDPMWARRFGIR